MRIVAVLLAGLLALSAHAFLIPDGLPDGSYLASYDLDGSTILIKDDDLDSVNPVPSKNDSNLGSRFTRRTNYAYPRCFPTHNLNRDDTDAANAIIQRFCGNGAWLGANKARFAKVGAVIAFVCSFQIPHICTAEQSSVGNELTTNACGAYNAGATTFTQRIDHHEITYGYQISPQFCQKPPV